MKAQHWIAAIALVTLAAPAFAQQPSPAGRIKVVSGSAFIVRSGRARDIGAGNDVWIIGTDNQVYRRAANEWMPMGGSGVRVSAGAEGTAWVVNQTGEVFRWDNDAFRRVGGSAVDIAANATGDTWMVGAGGGGGRGRGRNPRP